MQAFTGVKPWLWNDLDLALQGFGVGARAHVIRAALRELSFGYAGRDVDSTVAQQPAGTDPSSEGVRCRRSRATDVPSQPSPCVRPFYQTALRSDNLQTAERNVYGCAQVALVSVNATSLPSAVAAEPASGCVGAVASAAISCGPMARQRLPVTQQHPR